MVCKHCTYWGRYKDTVCDREGATGSRFEIRVTVADDQGLETDLVTAPDFGCIEFTPKMKGGLCL